MMLDELRKRRAARNQAIHTDATLAQTHAWKMAALAQAQAERARQSAQDATDALERVRKRSALTCASRSAAKTASSNSVADNVTKPMHENTLPGRRILVAEDDYILALDLSEELGRCGAEVIGPAGTLDNAVELAKSSLRIDAAVIDINLHGEFAFHLVDDLIARDIPVFFSTGYDREVVPYRLRHVPCYRKPTPPSEIIREIADLLGEQRLDRL